MLGLMTSVFGFNIQFSREFLHLRQSRKRSSGLRFWCCVEPNNRPFTLRKRIWLGLVLSWEARIGVTLDLTKIRAHLIMVLLYNYFLFCCYYISQILNLEIVFS